MGFTAYIPVLFEPLNRIMEFLNNCIYSENMRPKELDLALPNVSEQYQVACFHHLFIDFILRPHMEGPI